MSELVIYGIPGSPFVRAARGLGKLLWFPPFKPRFYGG